MHQPAPNYDDDGSTHLSFALFCGRCMIQTRRTHWYDQFVVKRLLVPLNLRSRNRISRSLSAWSQCIARHPTKVTKLVAIPLWRQILQLHTNQAGFTMQNDGNGDSRYDATTKWFHKSARDNENSNEMVRESESQLWKILERAGQRAGKNFRIVSNSLRFYIEIVVYGWHCSTWQQLTTSSWKVTATSTIVLHRPFSHHFLMRRSHGLVLRNFMNNLSKLIFFSFLFTHATTIAFIYHFLVASFLLSFAPSWWPQWSPSSVKSSVFPFILTSTLHKWYDTKVARILIHWNLNQNR